MRLLGRQVHLFLLKERHPYKLLLSLHLLLHLLLLLVVHHLEVTIDE